MQRTFGRIIATAALAVALAPLASSAHDDHCAADIFVLSGVDAGGSRAGSNPGAVTCTEHVEEIPASSNTTIPGATHAWAASFAQPSNGTATINGGDPIDLAFFHETVRDRYESQSLDLSAVVAGSIIEIFVDFDGEEDSGDEQRITYTRV